MLGLQLDPNGKISGRSESAERGVAGSGEMGVLADFWPACRTSMSSAHCLGNVRWHELGAVA